MWIAAAQKVDMNSTLATKFSVAHSLKDNNSMKIKPDKRLFARTDTQNIFIYVLIYDQRPVYQGTREELIYSPAVLRIVLRPSGCQNDEAGMKRPKKERLHRGLSATASRKARRPASLGPGNCESHGHSVRTGTRVYRPKENVYKQRIYHGDII